MGPLSGIRTMGTSSLSLSYSPIILAVTVVTGIRILASFLTLPQFSLQLIRLMLRMVALR